MFVDERVYGGLSPSAPKDYEAHEKRLVKEAHDVLKKVERILKPWLRRLHVTYKVRHDRSNISESQYLEVYWKPPREPVKHRYRPDGWDTLLKVRVSYHYMPGTPRVTFDGHRYLNLVLPMDDKTIANALKKLLQSVRRYINEFEERYWKHKVDLLKSDILLFKRSLDDMKKNGTAAPNVIKDTEKKLADMERDLKKALRREEAQAIAIAIPYPGQRLTLPRDLFTPEDIRKVKKAIDKYVVPALKKAKAFKKGAKSFGFKANLALNRLITKALSKSDLDYDTIETISHFLDIVSHAKHMVASDQYDPMKNKRHIQEAVNVKKVASMVADQLGVSVQDLQKFLKKNPNFLTLWGRLIVKGGSEKDIAQKFLNSVLASNERKTKKRGIRVVTESVDVIGKKDSDFGYNRLIRSGNTFKPSMKAKYYRRLPSGVYSILPTMHGPVFEAASIESDSLLKFEDSRQEQVTKEIDKFWGMRERYDSLGYRHVRGILLYGAPGVGKTCLLNRLMSEMADKGDIALIGSRSSSTNASALRSLREVERDRPLLVVLEDIDDLIRYDERSLLNLFDGGDTVNHVCYIGTTNYIESFPPRMLRPGRFDRKVQITPPPKEGRLAYLQSKLGLEEGDGRLDEYLDLTDGFTFSQMKEFVLATECLEEDPQAAAKRIRIGI